MLSNNDNKANLGSDSITFLALKIYLVKNDSNYSVLQIDEVIKEWQDKGKIDKKIAYDLRKKPKEFSINTIITEANDMVEALDEKVNEAVKFYR